MSACLSAGALLSADILGFRLQGLFDSRPGLFDLLLGLVRWWVKLMHDH